MSLMTSIQNYKAERARVLSMPKFVIEVFTIKTGEQVDSWTQRAENAEHAREIAERCYGPSDYSATITSV